ncbi:MAG: transcription antitermination factor NusB [Anaerolineales bacterium]|nr:transcription antitermination factor NusB [Anaerolineales bacterium]
MKLRTKARSLALQVLYEVDISDHAPGQVFQERLKELPLPVELQEFARQIVFGIIPIAKQLDKIIEQYAPEWPLDQIATIDRNILRIAAWEFGVQRDTPTKVAINEAVEIAKTFGSDAAPRFINGVLGSLAEHQNDIYQSAQHLEDKS